MNSFHFDSAFKALTVHDPFPWQRRLFHELRAGDLPPAVDIPTGLGKTAVMAIWLLARAAGAPLPRRLVYVVDRRAVVDQATDFAEEIRESLQKPALEAVRRDLGLAGRELPISTLRGQHVDNRKWMEDPAAPAIIVGTVDMIGSRLLFEGYGVSRRMRPYQAGLMGCDTLVLLDEAHLSRPFARLLQTIEQERRARVENDAGSVPAGRFAGPCACAGLPPPFRLLPLSATLGSDSSLQSAPFTLDNEDRENEIVRERLDASKTLTIENLGANASVEDVLAERAWELARQRTEAAGKPVRMLVYCDRRKVAESVAADLRRRCKLAKSGAAVILFVGGRRVYERQEAADELRRHGLLAGGEVPMNEPVFVVATSAGEVGVDLDADHLVCDLVAWERMVQRLGRVNRRGSGAARILVVDPGPPEKSAEDVARHEAAKGLLKSLPPAGDGHQAGPAALEKAARSSAERTTEACSSMPLHPALTRPLIDAWAMTSLGDHSGRPEVEPWLRGWVEQLPQTTVVWRRCLPVRVDSEGSRSRTVPLDGKAVEAFFDIAGPHAAERLETETWRVVEWLRKRARKLTRTLDALRRGERDPGVARDSEGAETDGGGSPAATAGAELTAPLHPEAPFAFVLDRGGRPADRDGEMDSVLRLREAASGLTVKELERRLAGRLLVVDARICGLNDGLLDAGDGGPVPTAEDNWGKPHEWDQDARNGADAAGLPAIRVRLLSDDEHDRLSAEPEAAREKDDQPSTAWRESWAEPYRVSAADRPKTFLIVEKRRGAAPDEDSRAMAPLQRLEEHQELAAQKADRIAEDLGLEKEDRAMLVAAARRHDEGKRAPRWQRAFNAPRKDGPYAKTPGPLNRHVLDGYRHEFQSMLDAEANGLDGLDRSDPRFELALHMIAAHHGHARPAVGIGGCDRLPPTAAARRAYAVGLRFARLQRQWGPWGLAWWEALLRAADQRASRELDEAARHARKKPAARTSQTAPRDDEPGALAAPTGGAR